MEYGNGGTEHTFGFLCDVGFFQNHLYVDNQLQANPKPLIVANKMPHFPTLPTFKTSA